jgi:single-stranded-DNA-specific exonuclease
MPSYSDNTKSPLWIYPKILPEICEEIVNEFNTHPVTAQILVSRGFTTLEQINNYLYGRLPDLYDPKLFPEIEKAVERVMRAIHTSENILIYGDNDVDGMTGTALLTEFLETIGAKVFYYVPNRNNLRDSLIIDALHFASKNECKLIITVDCGITAAENIEHVAKNNVDVIITDHHEPTAKIPHCVATLNPKILSGDYINKELTGVGVAFKLAHALTNHLNLVQDPVAAKIDLKEYLDLVALGTISDMASLLDENRILVRYGLRQIQSRQRIGLMKLFSICDIDPGTTAISVSDIASKIAPRLNSLGRIADPRKGVELLIMKDAEKAEKLALELDLNNTERQKIERAMSADVEDKILNTPSLFKEKAVILHSNEWHPGVIPIVTTRIAKQYNRPTVMIAVEDGVGKGSIRSIREFPLLNVLKERSDLLLNFGGHDFAAGLTIKEENIEEFKAFFISRANDILQDTDIMTKLYLDAHIDFKEIDFDFMESLNLLSPYGNENPHPILYCDVTQAWPPKIIGNNHLKMYVEQDDRMLEGIAFGMGDRRKELKRKKLNLRVAFTPQINNFHNKTSIQLLIRDIQII